MCPLRLILVFLSATLAGYFAWKTVRSPPPSPIVGDSSEIEDTVDGDSKKRRRFDARKVIGDGFWVSLDMARGRYLWRVMKGR